MVTNLKLITSSFIMALTLATPQLSHAMERDEDRALTLTTLPLSRANEKKFTDIIPMDVRKLIVKQVVFNQCLDNKSPVNLALVCKEWQGIINDDMQVGKPSWKAWYGVVGHEDIYQTFLKGVLVYRPDPQSDEGMIILKISDLPNPLEGTFDLAECGKASEDLSISTGYRKGIKPGNKDKVEIWLAPRFTIDKKINSSAKHLQPIMGNWNEEAAPVGIFFTRGEWKDLSWYEYVTDKSMSGTSSQNLINNRLYRRMQTSQSQALHGDATPAYYAIERFMFICKLK